MELGTLVGWLALLLAGYAIGWISGRADIAWEVNRYGNFLLKKQLYIVHERFDVGGSDE